MQVQVIHDNTAFEGRIRYVFDFIQNHPLSEGNFTFLFHGESSDAATIYFTKSQPQQGHPFPYIPAQTVVFSPSVNIPELVPNGYEFEGFLLQSVEYNSFSGNKPFYSAGQFGFDLMEALFFHISRMEECFCANEQKDVHGRMLADAQFLVRYQLEKLPVVDQLVYCFLQVLAREYKSACKPPRYFHTPFRLTYDVDILEKYARLPPFRSFAKYLFKNPNLSALTKLTSSYFATKSGNACDPYLTFDWMLRPDFKGEQVIYFLVGGTSRFDKPIPVINQLYREVLGLALERGLEIGLHPSYCCVDSLDRLAAEKMQLEKLTGNSIKKSRQHFLHFSFDTTPNILEQVGIEDDSSLGFSDRIGFRCGTGFPYFLYDFPTEQPHRLKETPMVIMDVALMREGKNNGERINKILEDFLHGNAHLTQITFNFHNSRFFDAELDGVDLRGIFNAILNS